jgi:hypothetical protein
MWKNPTYSLFSIKSIQYLDFGYSWNIDIDLLCSNWGCNASDAKIPGNNYDEP